MKPGFRIILSIVIITSLGLSSCKKDKSCEGCINGNKPPTAIAGPDQLIILPADSISLDGSASNDTDGRISSWLWKQIAGPASFLIINTNTIQTQVNNLVEGVYRFELKVTDDKGASAKDTIQITVDKSIVNNSSCTSFWIAVEDPYDTTLNLPANAVTLTASIEPTSNQPVQLTISSIEWTKVAGPENYTIQSPGTLSTSITNLTNGLYAFQCRITDISGCSRVSYGGGVINVTDTTTPGREIIIPDQAWEAEWYPYVKINLKEYIQSGKSVKKVFIKLDCDTAFTQVYPYFEFSGNEIYMYAYLPLTNSCLDTNTKVDIKIIY